MTALRVPSRVSELAADQTDASISVGAGGASGDLVVKTNTTERFRVTFAGLTSYSFGDAVQSTALTPAAGKLWNLTHGYTASPDTGYVPSVRLARILSHPATTTTGTNGTNSATINVTSTTGFAASGTIYVSGDATAVTYTGKTGTSFTGCSSHAAITAGTAITDFPFQGDAVENLSTLVVKAESSASTNGVQPVGVYARATNSGTSASALTAVSPDACGLYGHGVINSGGNGVAAGGCFVATKQSGSTGTNTALQLFSLNNVSDSSYSATGVSDTAFWVNAGGSYQSGAGMLFATAGKQFDVGIGFLKIGSVSSVKTASISDDSDSVTSLRISGSHTYGVDFAGGTFSVGPIRLPNQSSVYGRNAANDADVALFRFNSSDRLHFQTTTEFADGLNIVLNTTTGTMIGTGSTQKLGFLGATPIVRPSSTTDLRAALINFGLYTSGGASPLDLNGGKLTAAAGVFAAAGSVSTTGAIRLANGATNGAIKARNAADDADVTMCNLNSSDQFQVTPVLKPLDDISMTEGKNILIGTTTGTKIGHSTSSKIGFWNKTPIVQPTTGISGASNTNPGTGTAITSTSTFGGYTLAQLAAVIINTGLAA